MQLTTNLVARSVLAVAVFGAVLAGCSNTPGSPVPETTGATTSAAGDAGSTTTSAPAGDSLADFDACGQLEGVASELGLTAITEDGVRQCKARYAGTVGVLVKAFPELSIEEYVPGANSQITDFPMESHKAKRVTAPASSSSCAVTIEITSSSRVDVVSSARASLDEACDAAAKVATAIEPRLPK
ncbi:DUF3558 domain-containing protein [Saccharothrix sp. CB00851]|uniref:DUF3558 domain-containing protein n=1 Tax=Saccharothrix sp. CB00851 TaxID=1835005 RepID=UPI001A7E0ECF|nr:DUF3558 domain-containing protein [Saccharothrix sp. CB00851]